VIRGLSWGTQKAGASLSTLSKPFLADNGLLNREAWAYLIACTGSGLSEAIIPGESGRSPAHC